MNQPAYTVDPAEIQRALECFIGEDQVFEIRALNVKKSATFSYKVVSGYFDRKHLKEAVKEICTLGPKAKMVCFTINPIMQEALHRSANHMTEQFAEAANDLEVLRLRWFLIDIDPERLPGISSTEAEHDSALKLADVIEASMCQNGWPEPIKVDSGNGVHMYYRINESIEFKNMLKSALRALASQFNNDEAKIDLDVFNPARIVKLPGTWAKKGDHSPERPHRLSHFISIPKTIEVVGSELIETLAGSVILPLPEQASDTSCQTGEFHPAVGKETDVEFKIAWVREHFPGAKETATPGCMYWSVSCLNPEHENKGRIHLTEEGAIWQDCWHKSCPVTKWNQMKDHYDPDWKVREKTLKKAAKREKSECASVENLPYALMFHQTDLGNAEHLVFKHGKEIRYCHANKLWMTWKSIQWVADAGTTMLGCVRSILNDMHNDADNTSDKEVGKQLAAHASHSESNSRINAMIEIACNLPEVVVTIDQFDIDPMLLNCLTGTIDLSTGDLREHRSSDMISKIVPTWWQGIEHRYDAWDNFIHDCTDGDEELAAFLQRCAGYSLTGKTSAEVLFFLYGRAATGKTTFLETIKHVMGDYAMTSDFETFLRRPTSGSPRFDLARLRGARLVSSAELEGRTNLDAGMIKQFTGGDKIAARQLYEKSTEFKPTGKIWLMANERPGIRHDDTGMWRRVLVIPLDNVVPEAKRSSQLKEKLRDLEVAGPAILAWMVRGCLDWQKQGLNVPEAVHNASEKYRIEMHPLSQFFDDYCDIREDETWWTSTYTLYDKYTSWARNIHAEVLGNTAFGRELAGCGLKSKKENSQRGWSGIRIRPSREES